jgi:hypothetical protein
MSAGTIGFVRLVVTIFVTIANGRARNTVTLIRTGVFALSLAYIRRAGIRFVGSILTVGVSITVEMDGDASSVFTLKLRTGTTYFCRRVAALELIFT